GGARGGRGRGGGAEPAPARRRAGSPGRRWATSLPELAVGRLEAEMAAASRADLCARLLRALTGGRGGPSHPTIAADLEMTAGAVKMAASRLRRRYGELLREESAPTLADPSDLEDAG